MPVTTTAYAQTVAAIGAALLGGREPETATRLAAAPKVGMVTAAPVSPIVQPVAASLAWSESPLEVPSEGQSFDYTDFARPEVVFDHAIGEADELASLRWYQRPALLFAAAACAAVLAAVGLVVTTETKSANAASPMPSVSAPPTMSNAQVPATSAAEAVAPPVVTETVIEDGRPIVRYTQAPPAPRAPAPQVPAPAPQDPPPPVTSASTTTATTTETTPTTTETTPPTTTTSTPTTSTPTTSTPTTSTPTTSTPTSTTTSTTTSTSTSPPPKVGFPTLPPLELPTLLPVEPPANH
jgi:hypothetical protein